MERVFSFGNTLFFLHFLMLPTSANFIGAKYKETDWRIIHHCRAQPAPKFASLSDFRASTCEEAPSSTSFIADKSLSDRTRL